MRKKDIPALIQWYLEEGVEYPWGELSGATEKRPDPYLVWISEIMLQQTQVKAVIPYFLHWKEAYPDLESLAAAEEEEVMRSWEGLGYYSRARNILKCARELVSRGDASLPADYRDLIKLPGIGPYTAAAVLSICHGKFIPVMDANVKRLCQRWGEHRIWTGGLEMEWEVRLKKMMQESGADPGTLNCALMQLGQLVCRKTRPRCGSCPVSEGCLAGQRGTAEEIPESVKKNIKKWDSLALIYARGDRIFMEFRDRGIVRGLWSLPRIPMEEKLPAGWIKEANLSVRHHHFTTNRETLHPVILRESTEAAEPESAFPRTGWFSREQLRELAVPAVYRRILEEYLSESQNTPGKGVDFSGEISYF